jgi:hypothetical protein
MEMVDITFCTSKKIIDAENLKALGYKLVYKMRTQEACAAGNENAFAAFIVVRR